jgi:hypothetical protein
MTAPSRQSADLEERGRSREERGRSRYGADQPHRTAPDDQSQRTAPDGQRVVRAGEDFETKQAAVQRNADRTMTASREEGAHDPSVGFWHSRRAQAGPLLALLAGVFTLAIRTWPIVTPQGRGTVGTAWFLCATIAGALYVAGFFLSERRWIQARLVLICGAGLHLLVSVLASMAVDAQAVAPATLTMLFDVVPAIMALVAAALIRPVPEAR